MPGAQTKYDNIDGSRDEKWSCEVQYYDVCEENKEKTDKNFKI